MHKDPFEASGTNPGRTAYALRAWLVAAVPSLLYFFALVSIGTDSLRTPTGALDATFAGYSILAAPVLETALMFPVASLLALIIPRRPRARIVLLAMVCAVAHLFGGGWRQVIASFWPFLVYSATLTTWLKRSGRDAFVLTAFVHALYNATFISVGVIGNYVVAPGG